MIERCRFQRNMVEKYMSKDKGVVNLACKEDPAKLGRDFGAFNVDLIEHDVQTNTDLTKLPNFHKYDIRELPKEWNGKFSVAVLGDVIEHCTHEAAADVLISAADVAETIVVTLPFDNRTPEEQHSSENLFEIGDGCYSYHVHNWEEEFDELVEFCNLYFLERLEAKYPHCPGVFAVLRRKNWR